MLPVDSWLETPIRGILIANPWLWFLFVDARQVLYAIVRSLVVPVEGSDAAAAYFFQQLALLPEALQELQDLLADGPATESSGINAVAYMDITSTFSVCSFTVTG